MKEKRKWEEKEILDGLKRKVRSLEDLFLLFSQMLRTMKSSPCGVNSQRWSLQICEL
jgi:hypothetical protein